MSVIDFLRESAVYMTLDRPDVYENIETAVEELSTGMDSLREDGQMVSAISFTSYVLLRIVEDDVEEFMLSRKLSGVLLFGEEEVCTTISYSPHVNLPDVLEVYDDLDDED